jgi:GT2 family glycosyltransferase
LLFPDNLVLEPVSRWPTTLCDESLREVLDTPLDERLRPDRRAATVTAAPRVSLVIVTLDGLPFSRLCLETLLGNPTSLPYEAVVVDNGSTDGTVEYLHELAAQDQRVRVYSNGRNLGFGPAANRGVALARGDVLVLLNNDTIVPPGTLEALSDAVSDPCIGLAGVVTNRAGNEAEIDVSCRTYGEIGGVACARAREYGTHVFDIRTVTMFCAALRRHVWDEVGPLDERFEVGLFEDDDYAMRVRAAGYRVVCADGIFVHHFGQASIGRLGPTGEYGAVFHANRARWEAKWGAAWHPHERREKPGYQRLVERIRHIACEALPSDATVLVISKGDANLLKLDGRRAWHFPQADDGSYAGHYPADSEACVAELERLWAKGADYLLVPAPSAWWLEHYGAFAQYLEDRWPRVLRTAEFALFACGTRRQTAGGSEEAEGRV